MTMYQTYMYQNVVFRIINPCLMMLLKFYPILDSTQIEKSPTQITFCRVTSLSDPVLANMALSKNSDPDL